MLRVGVGSLLTCFFPSICWLSSEWVIERIGNDLDVWTLRYTWWVGKSYHIISSDNGGDSYSDSVYMFPFVLGDLLTWKLLLCVGHYLFDPSFLTRAVALLNRHWLASILHLCWIETIPQGIALCFGTIHYFTKTHGPWYLKLAIMSRVVAMLLRV